MSDQDASKIGSNEQIAKHMAERVINQVKNSKQKKPVSKSLKTE